MSFRHQADRQTADSDTITQLTHKHGNNFVIGGDFNHLDMGYVNDVFDLHNIVHFPKQNDAHQDKYTPTWML